MRCSRGRADTTARRSLLLAIAPATLVLALAAGCGGAHQSASGHSTTTKPGGHISKASPEPAGKTIPIPTSGNYKVSTPPGASKGYVGAAQDVKVSTCVSNKSTTLFNGTVTNPTDAVQSYRIYVAVTLKGATVGIDEVDVNTVAARTTNKWSGGLATGADGATCVLRVERTQQS